MSVSKFPKKLGCIEEEERKGGRERQTDRWRERQTERLKDREKRQ